MFNIQPYPCYPIYPFIQPEMRVYPLLYNPLPIIPVFHLPFAPSMEASAIHAPERAIHPKTLSENKIKLSYTTWMGLTHPPTVGYVRPDATPAIVHAFRNSDPRRSFPAIILGTE